MSQSSDSVRPDELLGDGAVWDFAQLGKEWTLLEVDVHAVSEAVVALANKCVLVNAERELGLASAALEALK